MYEATSTIAQELVTEHFFFSFFFFCPATSRIAIVCSNSIKIFFFSWLPLKKITFTFKLNQVSGPTFFYRLNGLLINGKILTYNDCK